MTGAPSTAPDAADERFFAPTYAQARAGFLVGDGFGDGLAAHAKALFAIQRPRPSAATLKMTDSAA